MYMYYNSRALRTASSAHAEHISTVHCEVQGQRKARTVLRGASALANLSVTLCYSATLM